MVISTCTVESGAAYAGVHPGQPDVALQHGRVHQRRGIADLVAGVARRTASTPTARGTGSFGVINPASACSRS